MAKKGMMQIQQGILEALREGPCSLRELETRLNTNYNSIRAHSRLLAFYGCVDIEEHERSEANGRPYTTLQITARGREVMREHAKAVRRM
jgi:predicted ArsR family transcriptional regulator